MFFFLPLNEKLGNPFLFITLTLVKKFIKSENTLLRGASIWSLRQLMTADEFTILKNKNIALEKESDVKKEWI